MLLLASLASGWSCASEEIPIYGDPARVAGGASGASGASGAGGGSGGSDTGGSGPCVVQEACAVSFKTDIFPVLDTRSKCSDDNLCHGPSVKESGLELKAMDVASYHKGLLEYSLADPAGKYIVPCNPKKSKFLCNMKLSEGTNPDPPCGTLMPQKAANGVTEAELEKIKDWIECGAPNN